MHYLGESIKVEQNGLECNVILPVRGRDGDFIEFYVREDKKTGVVLLTDEAETVADLVVNGTDILAGPARQLIVNSVLKSFGMRLENNELSMKVKPEDTADAVLRFLSAILSIQYVHYTSRPTKIKAFTSEVQLYLTTLDPEFQKQPEVKGASGENVRFDFGYAHQNLLVEALYATSPYAAFEKTLGFCMRATDARNLNAKLRFASFYDDTEEELGPIWTTRELHYLDKYIQHPIAWSKKEEFRNIIS